MFLNGVNDNIKVANYILPYLKIKGLSKVVEITKSVLSILHTMFIVFCQNLIINLYKSWKKYI
jgi:hypothetical protein